MLLGNDLFESFKVDVSASVISTSVYADTFRRKFIDTSAKIVRNGNKLMRRLLQPACNGCNSITSLSAV